VHRVYSVYRVYIVYIECIDHKQCIDYRVYRVCSIGFQLIEYIVGTTTVLVYNI